LKNKVKSLESEIINLKRRTDDEKMFVIGHGGQARVAVKNHDASEWSVGTYM
jgi:prefoldin subunit 5